MTLLLSRLCLTASSSLLRVDRLQESEEDAKMKEISFKNAYIVHYKETLDVNNEAPMTIAMTFSAENITVGNAELDNRWPRS